MVTIFGTSDCVEGHGQPGPPGTRGIKDLISWFPTMMLKQVRKNLNFLTFLIESIDPESEPDVELSAEKTVTKWKAFNNREHAFSFPVNKGKGGKLKLLSPRGSQKKRYGLVFDKKEENMYSMKFGYNIILNDSINKVLLTMSFLVGVDKDVVNDTEEFIVYEHDRRNVTGNFRGVSVMPKADEKFDLYLYGARGEDAEGKRLKIGEDIKMNFFYTLQVCWDSAELTGFYHLFKDRKVLLDKTYFQCTEMSSIVNAPSLLLGGFDASTNPRDKKVVKSKLFTGIISNLEILKIHPNQPSLPEELVKFIEQMQVVKNRNWNDDGNPRKKETGPPASKRRKVK